jgi:hypothetical protein
VYWLDLLDVAVLQGFGWFVFVYYNKLMWILVTIESFGSLLWIYGFGFGFGGPFVDLYGHLMPMS